MRISISCEPWRVSDGYNIKLSLSLEGFGDYKTYQKIIEEDWFKDESMFKRIVSGMADDLQRYYKEQKKQAG